MSGNRKEKSSSNSAVLSTIAAVGIGAIAAAGAFFVGKALGEEEAEAKLKAQQYHQSRQQQVGQGIRAPAPSSPVVTSDEDEDDPKSGDVGLETECSICMCAFEELKGRDVEIHTTPCGHIFCAKCISRCLLRKEECPACKQTVRQGQTLRIFL